MGWFEKMGVAMGDLFWCRQRELLWIVIFKEACDRDMTADISMQVLKQAAVKRHHLWGVPDWPVCICCAIVAPINR